VRNRRVKAGVYYIMISRSQRVNFKVKTAENAGSTWNISIKILYAQVNQISGISKINGRVLIIDILKPSTIQSERIEAKAAGIESQNNFNSGQRLNIREIDRQCNSPAGVG